MMREHEEVILGLQPVEWAQWMHHPITKGFFAYLGDFEGDLVAEITDRFMAGTLYDEPRGEGADLEGRNAHVLRGRVLTLQETRRITLEAILAYYRGKLGLGEDED
jgi:hypothetical protein